MRAFIASLLLSLALAPPAMAAEAPPARPVLTIAAASDLLACIDALNAAFQREQPTAELRTTTGASGTFVAQIKAGAPFDVFLSADLGYPRELIGSGFADAATLTRYATGRLALWTLRNDLPTLELATLASPAIGRIAIANPEVAPYGRAARAALQSAGLWDGVRARLVFGENIAQTAQFVQSGNADVGLVSLALLQAPKMAGVGHHVAVPAALHPPLEQGGVVTRHGHDNPLAATYLRFLTSPAARAVFDRHGFLPPAD